MSEFRECMKYCKENKNWTMRVMGAILAGLAIGAYFGVQAFYNGWLG